MERHRRGHRLAVGSRRRRAWALPVALVVCATAACLALVVLPGRQEQRPDAASPPGELVERDAATPPAGEADDGGSGAAGAAGGRVELPVAPTGSEMRSSYRSAADVPTEAASVLERYRDQGLCVLVSSGYLDLFGEVWGCVVQGGGWSEVAVVSAAADGAGSEVSVVRMDAQAWERSLEEEVGDVGDG